MSDFTLHPRLEITNVIVDYLSGIILKPVVVIDITTTGPVAKTDPESKWRVEVEVGDLVKTQHADHHAMAEVRITARAEIGDDTVSAASHMAHTVGEDVFQKMTSFNADHHRLAYIFGKWDLVLLADIFSRDDDKCEVRMEYELRFDPATSEPEPKSV